MVNLSHYDIDRIEKARQIIDAELSTHFTIETIAHKVHLGKTKLKGGFREHFGIAIFTYLKVQRMHHAAELLCYTNYTVKRIAAETGFKFTNNFNKAFSLYHGLTPGNYRKQFKVTANRKI